MDFSQFYQLLLFLFQGLTISSFILVLFHYRKRIGEGLLYATLGMFQFLQCFLASTVYVELLDGVLVSPGSTVVFSSMLFVVLLYYIKEDAIVARRLIYALVVANVILVILFLLFRLNIFGEGIVDRLNLSKSFFNINILAMTIGSGILFLDTIFIMLLYEFISKYVKKIVLRMFITTLIVLSCDYLCFCLVIFWDDPVRLNLLLSGLLVKGFVAAYYSIIFSTYLLYAKEKVVYENEFGFKDVFDLMTYREKFEQVEKERLKSVKQYKALSDISPVGIFSLDAKGLVTFVNNRLNAIAGVDPVKGVLHSWLKKIHPDDKALVIKNWECVRDGQEIPSMEYRFLHDDGHVSWVLGHLVRQVNVSGKVVGFVGTVTDITALKVYEIELNRLKDKAEESDRLKSAFLANYESRNTYPYEWYIRFCNVVERAKLTGDEKELYISLIEESSTRMLNVIRDIIDISKIESGQVKLVCSKFSLNQIQEEIHQYFMPEADRKELVLSYVNGLEDEEAMIESDKEKLEVF